MIKISDAELDVMQVFWNKEISPVYFALQL